MVGCLKTVSATLYPNNKPGILDMIPGSLPLTTFTNISRKLRPMLVQFNLHCIYDSKKLAFTWNLEAYVYSELAVLPKV